MDHCLQMQPIVPKWELFLAKLSLLFKNEQFGQEQGAVSQKSRNFSDLFRVL